MRRPPLLLAIALLVACGGDTDGSRAPCDLLPLDAAKALVGEDIERVRVVDVVPADAGRAEREQAAAADRRSCVYAPSGTGPGDEPDTAVGIQIDEGMPYDTQDELLETSGAGAEALAGVGDGAIIETEAGGFTIVVLLGGDRSFALVARSPGLEREPVVELARELAEALD